MALTLHSFLVIPSPLISVNLKIQSHIQDYFLTWRFALIVAERTEMAKKSYYVNLATTVLGFRITAAEGKG